jgi:hypothetical protein
MLIINIWNLSRYFIVVMTYKLLTSSKWSHFLSLTTCDLAVLPSFLLNQRELELHLQYGQSSWQNVLMPSGLTVLQGLEFLFYFPQLLAAWCAEQWFPEICISLLHPAFKKIKFSKIYFEWRKSTNWAHLRTMFWWSTKGMKRIMQC